jgi:hypothetical protein
MRILIWASVVFAAVHGAGAAVAADTEFTGTVKELKASPYAAKGGVGRVLLQDNNKTLIAFHVMNNTKISKMVDGKAQPAKYEDLAVGDTVRASYDGKVLESKPPQAFATEIVIEKKAK